MTRPRSNSRSPFSIWGLIEVGAFLAIVGTLLGFLGREFWICDLFTSFHVQFLWGLLLLAPLFWFGRRKAFAGVCLIGAIINMGMVLPVYFDRSNVSETRRHDLRVVLYNVYTSNPNREEVIQWIRAQEADVVGLCEINNAWAEDLDGLRDLYPGQMVHPRGDNFGMALLFRDQDFQDQSIESESLLLPTLRARWSGSLMDQPIPFLLSHPVPPMKPDWWEKRNTVLSEITEYHPKDSALIVLGDLNTPPWSPHFRHLKKTTGLHDTRRGFGVHPSWSPKVPVLGSLFQIPIDHILVGEGWKVVQRTLGPAMGSDHQPVVVDLVWNR